MVVVVVLVLQDKILQLLSLFYEAAELPLAAFGTA